MGGKESRQVQGAELVPARGSSVAVIYGIPTINQPLDVHRLTYPPSPQTGVLVPTSLSRKLRHGEFKSLD